MYSSEPIKLFKITKSLRGTIILPASKSISNRLLIINALSKDKIIIDNLSLASDTQILKERLLSKNKVIDVGDAGTAMRFLTALKAITAADVILQGTERMHERPIGPLVDALRQIGAEINYLEQENFPPLQIKKFQQANRNIDVPGNVSSQFISALLMIAPALPLGLKINIIGKLTSQPYVLMTIKLLEKCGISVLQFTDSLEIQPQDFQPAIVSVEPDWSGASYWFAFVALNKGANILLPGLLKNSLQGDFTIIDIAEKWGVKASFSPKGLMLENSNQTTDEQAIDFTDIPDLAQTIAVVHACLGIKGIYTGMESLRIKETDRLKALQVELEKIGAELIEYPGHWELIPSGNLPQTVRINTYHDHRMAMAFSPLCTIMDVEINNKEVVNKSYPNFWADIKSLEIEVI